MVEDCESSRVSTLGSEGDHYTQFSTRPSRCQEGKSIQPWRIDISSSSGSGRLEYPGNQVVVVGFCDFTTVEPTELGSGIFREVADEHLAVDLRRVHGRAALEQ